MSGIPGQCSCRQAAHGRAASATASAAGRRCVTCRKLTEMTGRLARRILHDSVAGAIQDHQLKLALHMANGQLAVQPVGAGQQHQLRTAADQPTDWQTSPASAAPWQPGRCATRSVRRPVGVAAATAH